jgi:hypothetical protein
MALLKVNQLTGLGPPHQGNVGGGHRSTKDQTEVSKSVATSRSEFRLVQAWQGLAGHRGHGGKARPGRATSPTSGAGPGWQGKSLARRSYVGWDGRGVDTRKR